MELPSLFGLLVTAGFPHLLRVGCIVQVASSDDGKCVVTDVSSGQSVTVINIMSRAVTVVSTVYVIVNVIDCVIVNVINCVFVLMSLTVSLLMSLTVIGNVIDCVIVNVINVIDCVIVNVINVINCVIVNVIDCVIVNVINCVTGYVTI